jgi:tripartite-type tricarboxylate transporter receptor subunit TctC
LNRGTLLVLIAAFALAVPAGVNAQAAFTTRPLRLVVPFAPGGPTDVFARQYAARRSCSSCIRR